MVKEPHNPNINSEPKCKHKTKTAMIIRTTTHIVNKALEKCKLTAEENEKMIQLLFSNPLTPKVANGKLRYTNRAEELLYQMNARIYVETETVDTKTHKFIFSIIGEATPALFHVEQNNNHYWYMDADADNDEYINMFPVSELELKFIVAALEVCTWQCVHASSNRYKYIRDAYDDAYILDIQEGADERMIFK